MAAAMKAVFPDALSPLRECDPEVFALIQEEKTRQWCALRRSPCFPERACCTCWRQSVDSSAATWLAGPHGRLDGLRRLQTLPLCFVPFRRAALTRVCHAVVGLLSARALSSLPARTSRRRPSWRRWAAPSQTSTRKASQARATTAATKSSTRSDRHGCWPRTAHAPGASRWAALTARTEVVQLWTTAAPLSLPRDCCLYAGMPHPGSLTPSLSHTRTRAGGELVS